MASFHPDLNHSVRKACRELKGVLA
jgi:hypothetical protein